MNQDPQRPSEPITEPFSGPVEDPRVGDHIGRYRLERLLGEGGFGQVYLARDDQLNRFVAVKLPHEHLVSSAGDAELYLTEARTLAGLDHPHIVPVYDVGSSEQYPCYVISKYVAGIDLGKRLRRGRLPTADSAGLVATVARALHYAHKRGLVHRDVKPSNILLDASEAAYLTDFGVALREQQVDSGPQYVGTPAYMSPEQARGEGHRVDGRSDVYSLGVVFYEMLAGRRPFQAASNQELLVKISTLDPRPPRQVDDTIPRELERICLRALAKRGHDRYTTALDLADDLERYLKTAVAGEGAARSASADDTAPKTEPAGDTTTATAGDDAAKTPAERAATTPSSWSQLATAAVVPKGLRPFDANDADFFLELLPGPRDRFGLPDQLRFWKLQIESRADQCAVGLLYGPSGSGKSSLVRAGLLPRLAENVVPVYIEATQNDTEARLLTAIMRRCPGLASQESVASAVRAVRCGRGLPEGEKLLLVIDQFEQWLFGTEEIESDTLTDALRQADGERVQCLLLVRDDFWMAATRLLRALEIRLVEGVNSAAADLFDKRHARRVLTAFGRAYQALPQPPEELSRDQRQFVEQAVDQLARDGMVVPVQLVLFTEMVKTLPWSTATLRQLGGAEGVGVAFLETTFGGQYAPPQYRLHGAAIREVLAALLPARGQNLKGHVRTLDELGQRAGLQRNPEALAEVLQILDADLRLITPVDTADREGGEREIGYQLAHDYLIGPIREWLVRQQRTTRGGRASLRLAERTDLWSRQQERRQLPTAWEWLTIRCFTPPSAWTAPQRDMMRAAGKLHVLRMVLAVVLLVAGGLFWSQWSARSQARAYVQQLTSASAAEVPEILGRLEPYRRWSDPLLESSWTAETASERERLHIAAALSDRDAQYLDYFVQQYLSTEARDVPSWVPVVKRRLAHGDGRLWEVLEQSGATGAAARLRAAVVLAAAGPGDERWAACAPQLVRDLLAENSTAVHIWTEGLRPVRAALAPELLAAFRRRDEHSRRAGDVLVAQAGEENTLIDILSDGDAARFRDVFDKLLPLRDQAVTELKSRWSDLQLQAADAPLPHDLAHRQANLTVALLRLGEATPAWTLLRRAPDATRRYALITGLRGRGVPASQLLRRLGVEQREDVRAALILALGQYDADELSEADRLTLISDLADCYCTDHDPEVHAAVEWTLRRWSQTDRLSDLVEKLRGQPDASPSWLHTRAGTMTVIQAPTEFLMGSPEDEPHRAAGSGEQQHMRRIEYTFAIGTKEITVGRFAEFLEDTGRTLEYNAEFAPTDDCPQVSVTWFDAAAFCNWLSGQEGLPESEWCYEPNAEGHYAAGMKIVADYPRRRGYRLPDEWEWELACRDVSATPRYFGGSLSVADECAWHRANAQGRTHPTGTLLPNTLGLFDALGNVFEWCQQGEEVPASTVGAAGDAVTLDLEPRVLRGGSFANPADRLRAASRSHYAPQLPNASVGFRVVRVLRDAL